MRFCAVKKMSRAVVVSIITLALLSACNEKELSKNQHIKQLSDKKVTTMAEAVEAIVSPQLSDDLTLKLWAVDSLVADPVSIDIDDNGVLYYTRTNRQKNSEFDIRSHQDWEIESIKLRNVEEKREFLKKILSPENSKKNEWLADLNGDGSHDWRDMTIEKEHVYRVEDRSGDGRADRSQRIMEDFHEEVTDAAGGILKYGDDLFVGIGPDLWKVHDSQPNEKKSISHGYGIHVGFSGHGMSGIEVGPEGKIYWQIGDIGFSGKGPNGQTWEHPNSGVIVRSNPDGTDFEVFAYGNRNTHEFVFDEYGNLISEDNDGDHPGESERIVYIVNGADIGWRTNWQFGKYRDPENNTYKVWMDEKLYLPRFEGQAAYITPAIANYVNGPTGMLYNPGTALSAEWKNYFFIAEFVGNPSKSGIHAFKLNPKGATFELGESKKVMGGVLATGIDWGPDGAMYIADWIDGWDTKDHGRIWKLDVSNADGKIRKQVQQLLGDTFADFDEGELIELLKHEDMRVRQKAQFEIASRAGEGMDIFKEAIAQTENKFARIHAIWGIRQLAQHDPEQMSFVVPLLKDKDPEIRAQAAKWLGDARYDDAGPALLPVLNDTYSRARFFAAEALGRIAFHQAVNPLIQLLASNNDEDAYIRHAGSLALARIGNADVLAALTSHESKAVRLAAVLALRRMGHVSISNFLNDSDEYIVTEAARGINDDLSIEAVLPALGNVLNVTPFTNEALIRRAINANLRTGSDEALQNLLTYTANAKNPSAVRAEALAALSTWTKPSVLDRVDGRYRGDFKRDAKRVKELSSKTLITLLTDRDASVRLHAVIAIGKLKIEGASQNLFTRLKIDTDASVRKETLKALALIEDKKIAQAITLAMTDKEKNVRVTALDLLPKMNLSKELMVVLLKDVINTKTIEEKQAALSTLGNLPLTYTETVFNELLLKLENKKLPPAINLELSDAIDQTGSKTLKAKFKNILVSATPDTLQAAFEGALYGGDRERGRRIFYSNQTAQCMRCHSYGDQGGNAGPRLNGVAKRLSREQLLEALIKPSARLAPGYGTLTVALKNGKTISGVLQKEQADFVTLKIGNKPDTIIQQLDIAKRTAGSSSMPPMGLLLTKKEVRDIVSFLATLEE
jgi:putative heme-binding domain-containing protein